MKSVKYYKKVKEYSFKSSSLNLLLFCFYFLTGCYQQVSYPNGGYNYPSSKNIDSNFYYLPLKDVFSKEDSILALEETSLYKGFHEPNLSIRPADEDIFRITYQGFMTKPVIITLLKHKIIVKEGNQYSTEYFLDDKLTKDEKYYHYLLRRYYPLNEPNRNWTNERKYKIDSLVKMKPELLDPNYYIYLRKKGTVSLLDSFRYTVKQIFISTKVYHHLISLINESGYWNLPIHIPCKDSPTDGDGLILEANTSKKYNWVNLSACEDPPTKFAYAVQEIINYAQKENEINFIGQPPH